MGAVISSHHNRIEHESPGRIEITFLGARRGFARPIRGLFSIEIRLGGGRSPETDQYGNNIRGYVQCFSILLGEITDFVPPDLVHRVNRTE